MTIYYVRKDGNDTTGNGSTGTPWLTLSKVLSVATGGDTVNVGAGTYAENTSALGYFYVSRNAASELIVQSESGNAADVTITGTSGTTYNVLLAAGSNNLTFKNLTFSMSSATPSTCIRQAAGANIKFDACVININTASGQRDGIALQCTSGQAIIGTVLTGCTFRTTGANNARGVWSDGYPATTSISNVAITNCTFANAGGTSSPGSGIVLQGVTTAAITSCTIVSNLYGIIVGVDGTSGQTASSVSISGCTIRAGGHGLLLGAGCDAPSVSGCNIDGGDYSLVIKQCTGAVAEHNVIFTGTGACVYFKAANGATLRNNRLLCTAGVAIKAGYDALNGATFGTLTVRGNTVRVSGTGKVFDWAAAPDDTGGCVVDCNIYDPKTTGKFGAVRADADVQSLAELRDAWTGYDTAGNDVHSRLFSANMIILPRLIGHR
jgi:hypothetical protein